MKVTLIVLALMPIVVLGAGTQAKPPAPALSPTVPKRSAPAPVPAPKPKPVPVKAAPVTPPRRTAPAPVPKRTVPVQPRPPVPRAPVQPRAPAPRAPQRKPPAPVVRKPLKPNPVKTRVNPNAARTRNPAQRTTSQTRTQTQTRTRTPAHLITKTTNTQTTKTKTPITINSKINKPLTNKTIKTQLNKNQKNSTTTARKPTLKNGKDPKDPKDPKGPKDNKDPKDPKNKKKATIKTRVPKPKDPKTKTDKDADKQKPSKKQSLADKVLGNKKNVPEDLKKKTGNGSLNGSNQPGPGPAPRSNPAPSGPENSGPSELGSFHNGGGPSRNSGDQSNNGGGPSNNGGGPSDNGAGPGEPETNGGNAPPGNTLDTTPPSTGDGKAIVDAARSLIGTPYSWGGGSINGKTFGIDEGKGTFGVDCSGLALFAVHKGTGKTIARVAEAQYADSQCHHVPYEQHQPGDLVFFNDGGSIHHVAILSGQDTIVHAPQTGDFVKEAKIWENGRMAQVTRCF